MLNFLAIPLSRSSAVRRVPERFLAPILWIFIFALLVIRLPLGVDLRDEAFDFSHILDWMRNGFSSSPNLNIRQTSALLLYPLAVLYVKIMGGLDGILLYMRAWVIVMAMLASVAFYDFLRNLRPLRTAALSSAIFFAFIPWAFLVPEYDNMGMYGFVTALSLLGSATLLGASNPKATLWSQPSLMLRLIGSSICWVFSIISYPPLVISFVVFGVVVLFWLPLESRRRIAVFYVICCITAFSMGTCLLIAVFGFERIRLMYEFTASTYQLVVGVPDRFATSLGYLSRGPIFSALLVATAFLAVVCAIWRNQAVTFWACLCVTALVAACVPLTPVLFETSNDISLLLGIFSFYLIFRPEETTLRSGMVRVFVMTCLVSGLVYSWAAGMGLLNVAYGVSAAACLGLALIVPDQTNINARLRYAHQVLLVFILGLACASTLLVVEGYDPKWPDDLQRVETGLFRGLYTTPAQKTYIANVQRAFAEVSGPGHTVTVFGDAGLYLLTDMAPRALSTWNYELRSGTVAARMVFEYFAEPSNQADFIVIDTPRQLSETVTNLLKNYRLLTRGKVGSDGFMLYRRMDHPGGQSPLGGSD